MRRSSVALVVLTAGLTASAVVRRVLARRRAAGSPPAIRSVAPAAPVAATLPVTTVEKPAPADDAVVLPFTRRAGSVPPARPQGAARCGDTGGRTKAGAPCAARATGNGRCHHHRVAA
jgi:hypothetical protein